MLCAGSQTGVYYPDINDMKLHIELMKQRGYSVWESDEEELYAEFEMAEAIDSEASSKKWR